MMPAAGAVGAAEVAIAAGYALVIAAVVAERVWLAVRTGDARLGPLATAAAMGAGAVAVGGVVVGVERTLWPVLGGLAPGPVSAVVGTHPVLEVVVVFVAWDAAGFAHHWLGHRTTIGWASHQVHHTGADYDLSLAWRQSWFPLTALATFPLVALTGGRFEVAVGCALVSNTFQALLHTAVDVPVPRRVGAVVMTPASHRTHHASARPVNLGPVLTVWDRLAGSWAPDAIAAPTPRAGRAWDNPLAVEVRGWRELLQRGDRRDLRSDPRSDWTMRTPTAQPRGLKYRCRSRSRPRTALG